MGLTNVLKLSGRLVAKDNKGNTVVWVWDYAENKARKENEMTDEQFAKSEKTKWENIKNQLNEIQINKN